MSAFNSKPQTPASALYLRGQRPQTLALAVSAALAYLTVGLSTAQAQSAAPSDGVTTLAPVAVNANAPASGDTLTPAFAGGQVAKGGRLGVLGQQDAANVPFSVSSFTAQLVQDQQAYTLADILKNDPAVQSSYGYGNFAQSFVIRGFPLYGDDISLGGLYGIMPRQIVSTQIAERIEIFKGPSAFLNGVPPGGSGVGGMVNVEPKRADDDPLTRFSVDYGTSSQVGGSADIGRRFGTDNQFGIRVNALQREGGVGIDDESRRMTFGSLALDYRGERLRTSLDVGYQKQNTSQGRPTVMLTGDSIPDAPSARRNYSQPWAYSTTENTFGMLRAEYDLNDSVTAYAALGGNHAREQGSYTTPRIGADGIGTDSRLDVPYESDSVSSMFGVRGKFTTGAVNHSVNAAFSSTYRKKATAYTMSGSFATDLYNPPVVPRPDTIYAGGDMNNPGVTERSRMNGVSLSDTLSILDERVLLTLGVRSQHLDVTGYDYTGVTNAQYSERATTPVYGLVVKPWEQVSLYANHIEGLQQGPTAPFSAANYGQVFSPTRSKQTEIGVKWDLGDYGASLAAYEIKQPTGYTDAATNLFDIAGEQRNRGLEMNVYGEPWRGLRLIGGIALIDAKMTATGQAATDGNKAIGVPNYQANLGAEWDLPWVPGLSLQGLVVRTGSQYLDAANQLKLDPWTRVDLGMRYAMKVDSHNVVWRLGVENVANKSYWASANGGYLTQGAPRIAKLSMTVDF